MWLEIGVEKPKQAPGLSFGIHRLRRDGDRLFQGLAVCARAK